MSGRNSCINNKPMLYCILTITLILRIVTYKHHHHNFKPMWNFWRKLKRKLHILKNAPWRWPKVKAEKCRSFQLTKVLCNSLVLDFTYVIYLQEKCTTSNFSTVLFSYSGRPDIRVLHLLFIFVYYKRVQILSTWKLWDITSTSQYLKTVT